MKRLTLLAAAMTLAAGSISAQQTALNEGFTGTFPPAGWTLVNNNAAASQGWIQDTVNYRAWHEDESGYTSDNTMITPVMDLTSFSSVFLHFSGETNWAAYLANHPAGFGDGSNTVEVTTDGGLTWSTLWTDTSLNNGETYSPDIDISAFAGMNNVQLGFHYYGTFAQEWWIASVLVNDDFNSPPPPGETWVVNLPTAFASLPFAENFDVNAGTLPPYMALTNVDPATGLTDAEAWCNVGNLAPCLVPFSGLYNLEMGLLPGSTNYHYVRNAMVLGIDGSLQAGVSMDYMGYNAGEEADAIDGIWVSSDGTNWYRVGDKWNTVLTPTSTWVSITALDLSGTPVDTSGQFYLMFAQEDNFPYNNADGVGIDDIAIDGSGNALNYSISNLVAGQTATFSVVGATPLGSVLLGYSVTGAGPTLTQYGYVSMSLPISVLASLAADANGDASFSPTVPANLAGTTIFTQGVDLGSSQLTNALAITIL